MARQHASNKNSIQHITYNTLWDKHKNKNAFHVAIFGNTTQVLGLIKSTITVTNVVENNHLNGMITMEWWSI